MRTVVLRVVALAVLLFLVLSSVLILQTMRRLPDTLVYFVVDESGYFTLEPVGRRHQGDGPEERARAAVEELVEGPTSGEREQGLTTALPEDLEIRSVSFDGGILQVDLSGEVEQGGGSSLMQARLYQLLYTLTQPGEVEGVRLTIDGRRVEAFGGEGILVEQPWLRAEHEELPAW